MIVRGDQLGDDVYAEFHQFIDDLAVIDAGVILLREIVAQVGARSQVKLPDPDVGGQAFCGNCRNVGRRRPVCIQPVDEWPDEAGL
jgi:hypothetical protein